MKLGKKKEIDIRTIWKHEANGFTKWLASEENLAILSENLNLNLSLIEREKSVGDFKCDIFCKDEESEKNVVIENQLTQTNHDHLGKIITYASGLKASIIIWIVQKARDEHISAIAWLNDNTDEDIQFFLIEMHAYAIDDSLPAPEFKIVEKPKEFNKKIKTLISSTKSDLNYKQLEFWEKFNEYFKQYSSIFNIKKALPQSWYDLSIGGAAKYFLRTSLTQRDQKIEIAFFINKDKSIYDKLLKFKDEINENIPYDLVWDRLDLNNKNSSKIYTNLYGLDLWDDSTYFNLIKKVSSILIDFNKIFTKYI